MNGKNMKRLSFGDFTHTINSSPNANYFISTYSNLSNPNRMALLDNNGKLIRELGDSKGAGFASYVLPKTEMKWYTTRDGLTLPMNITWPLNFDPNKKYPVLVSIYGGPNAGTVYDTWRTSGGNQYWMAKEGMIQVAIDNRSSGHLGKAGMNYIHRQLGKYEIEDYVDAAKWLKKNSFVDSNKICITGGSFGGYMTCMALTYGADTYTHGIALSSVTDWQLYDTHYTERFMDRPVDNPDGYKVTSVMTHAANYKGLLRIVHGTADDNVHMQNSTQLIDKLQNLGKRFEMMMYPNDRHGIGGAHGAHNRTESMRFYYKNLLEKPYPEEMFKRGF
jgi:dipeptidyl-peptidase 4